LPLISGNNSNLVDADLTNNVSFNLTGLGCNITIAVKDNDVLTRIQQDIMQVSKSDQLT
jgi:hypothetical protein